ncbi:NAD(P)H-dependent flavin oxidoreductase [Ramlibacter rhizophilus]|uniref:Nitronate monooxygenase n=1 Tax=Ramlibacter rhizophilus TaxID=1781167 RepID=A0A4Z0BHM5_9BURK|nr:nitronate monooxygenase [Ramlibacter rhizophilus]TFY97963.1 nitronate monooxygenase [Ramlibacter rhizophilus]
MTPRDLLARLQVPVVAAPMFLVSGPELVVAACRAGIVGAFPTPNARPIEVLERWLEDITAGLDRARDEQPENTIAPWCANLVTHSSNMRLPEDLRLVGRYQPPLVVTALGSPRPAIETVHGYGGLVLADVTTLALARKAVEAGADGLACICHGAGGHTGALSPFAFVSAVREFFDGLVIVGGAISDGWGVAGAIAAGADLVYMGTRFIAARESLADAAYKQMLVDSSASDIVVSAGLTGTPASWLKPSLRANGIDPEQLPATPPPRSYDSSDVEKTKRWRDIWAAGQGVGAVKSVQPVAQIVRELREEYLAAGERFQRRLARGTAAIDMQESVHE